MSKQRYQCTVCGRLFVYEEIWAAWEVDHERCNTCHQREHAVYQGEQLREKMHRERVQKLPWPSVEIAGFWARAREKDSFRWTP